MQQNDGVRGIGQLDVLVVTCSVEICLEGERADGTLGLASRLDKENSADLEATSLVANEVLPCLCILRAFSRDLLALGTAECSRSAVWIEYLC